MIPRSLSSIFHERKRNVRGDIMVSSRKLLFVFSVLFANLCSGEPEVSARFEAKVVAIVDGDTIKIELSDETILRVRLLGIDTPETNFHHMSQGYYAEEAKKYLERRLPLESMVEVRTGEKLIGSCGRILGRIFFRGRDLNRALLRRGLAALYMIYPFDREMLRSYVKASTLAVEEGRGMFDRENPIEYLPYVFRLIVREREPTRFVGNFDTKLFYPPDCFRNISVSKRVFFASAEEALKAGFMKAEEGFYE